MDKDFHSMEKLFLQLGLNNGSREITRFIQRHQLAPSQHIEDAPFWTDSQAAFIRECLYEDSDWAAVVDRLNARLHDHT